MTNIPNDIRRAFRVDTSFDAEIVVSAKRQGVVVRNLSPTGAQLEGLDDLASGEQLSLSIAELGDHEAVVVWSAASSAGIKFVQPIELETFHRWQLATVPSSLISPSKLEWLRQLING